MMRFSVFFFALFLVGCLNHGVAVVEGYVPQPPPPVLTPDQILASTECTTYGLSTLGVGFGAHLVSDGLGYLSLFKQDGEPFFSLRSYETEEEMGWDASERLLTGSSVGIQLVMGNSTGGYTAIANTHDDTGRLKQIFLQLDPDGGVAASAMSDPFPIHVGFDGRVAWTDSWNDDDGTFHAVATVSRIDENANFVDHTPIAEEAADQFDGIVGFAHLGSTSAVAVNRFVLGEHGVTTSLVVLLAQDGVASNAATEAFIAADAPIEFEIQKMLALEDRFVAVWNDYSDAPHSTTYLTEIFPDGTVGTTFETSSPVTDIEVIDNGYAAVTGFTGPVSSTVQLLLLNREGVVITAFVHSSVGPNLAGHMPKLAKADERHFGIVWERFPDLDFTDEDYSSVGEMLRYTCHTNQP